VLVVVTRILHSVAWVSWRTDARLSLVGRARTLRSQGAIAAMWTERLPARTLVQGNLRCRGPRNSAVDM
jgi:hypothetical protein